MDNINSVAIGNRIKKCRQEQKVTQEQLAEICDVSASYIGHIERGDRNLSMNTAIKISSALGIGLDYLFFETAENDDEVINYIKSALRHCNAEQRKKFLSTIKILAQNIDEL